MNMEIKRIFDILNLYKEIFQNLEDAFSYKDKGTWILLQMIITNMLIYLRADY